LNETFGILRPRKKFFKNREIKFSKIEIVSFRLACSTFLRR